MRTSGVDDGVGDGGGRCVVISLVEGDWAPVVVAE